MGTSTRASCTCNLGQPYVNELIHIFDVEIKRKKEAKKENIMMIMNVFFI